MIGKAGSGIRLCGRVTGKAGNVLGCVVGWHGVVG